MVGGRSYRTVSWTDETRRSPPPSWDIYPNVKTISKKHSLCAVREKKKKNMSILLIIIILFVMFIMYNVKIPLLFDGDEFPFWEPSPVNKELYLCLLLWAPHTRDTAEQTRIHLVHRCKYDQSATCNSQQITCCSSQRSASADSKISGLSLSKKDRHFQYTVTTIMALPSLFGVLLKDF